MHGVVAIQHLLATFGQRKTTLLKKMKDFNKIQQIEACTSRCTWHHDHVSINKVREFPKDNKNEGQARSGLRKMYDSWV